MSGLYWLSTLDFFKFMMKKTAFVFIPAIFGFLLGCGNQSTENKKEPVEYVNILMGTQSKFSLSSGNTYPAIARPWGMNFFSVHANE